MANKKKEEMSLDEKALNYGDEMVTLDNFIQQVRQTPDVYIGRVNNNAAFVTMVREIFQNAVDEILKGNAYTQNVYVTYDERNHQVTVEDNGRGIPHGMIAEIFGSSHTSSNYNKKLGVYSAGKNGCGGSTTNALSHKFTVDSYVSANNKAVHAEFIEGYIWKKGEVPIKCNGKQGSIVSFIPNEDIVGTVTTTWKEIYDLLAMITPSAPIGTHVEYLGIDSKGVKHMETIDNRDGVLSYIINMTQNPYIEPITICNDNGIQKCTVIFTWDTTLENGFEEHITSLNNTCPTASGAHVDGALKGITTFFRDYMNKIFLNGVNTKKKQLVCSVNDIRAGLQLAVSTFHLYASYDGQAKQILAEADKPEYKIIPFISKTVMDGLNEWSQTHSNELQKLCRFFKEVIESRLKQDKEKVKLSTKFQPSIFGGLPSKYVRPNGRRGIELLIVEGDSALGSARNSRNNATQGIFPIRGKLPNAFEKSRTDMLNNEEIAGILTIIGAGYGKNFDLSKCKVDRVIIMADADPDGAHIRTLVLRFLAMYCRPMVEAGMVYAVLPPLYAIPTGRNGQREYFGDQLQFVKYVQKEFVKYNTVETINGKKLTQKDITELLYRNDGYAQELDRVANTFAIDPWLLECILLNINNKKFASEIKSKYRFLDIEKKGGVVYAISGIANEKYHEIYVNDVILNESKELFSYINESDPYYILNGNKASLYDVMYTFNSFKPAKLERFKGLGEMNPKMLGESTLNPENRNLVRYTFEKFEQEMQEMRSINSNKDLLLK